CTGGSGHASAAITGEERTSDPAETYARPPHGSIAAAVAGGRSGPFDRSVGMLRPAVASPHAQPSSAKPSTTLTSGYPGGQISRSAPAVASRVGPAIRSTAGATAAAERPTSSDTAAVPPKMVTGTSSSVR